MNLTIDLSERDAAELAAQAQAARIPTERYLAQIVTRALEQQHRVAAENLEKHIDRMASQVVPETTVEEMESALQEAFVHARPQRRWQR